MLRVRLFGPITAEVDGQPLPPLRSRRGLYLLALLTLRANREIARLWLAGTLWPESSDAQALDNLKRSLTDLRKALGSEAGHLQSPSKHSLLFTLTSDEADVLAFDTALAQDTVTSLEHAVTLYTAPLLEGCYELWAVQEQESRTEAYLQAVERLASRKQATGQLALQVPHLRQALRLDRARESVARLLMEALCEGGNLAAATEVYRELRTYLLQTSNTTPSASLTALYNQIRTGTLTPPPTPPPPTPAAPTAPRFILPRPLTELIGREREQEAIRECLTNARLVTLTGTGGIGKTRLALQTAWDAQKHFPDGACFVDLAPLQDPGHLLQVTASALGLREIDQQPLRESVRDFLRKTQILLVIDNCEHVLEAAAVLFGTLLVECPQLQVLATSRQPLGVTGEVVWRVPALPVPPPGALEEAAITRYAALQLFFARAQAVQPELTYTSETIAAAQEICRRLDGIPLALELAAARVRSLSVVEVAARLDDRFRLLTGGSRSALPRQQTLRALIDWSYELLSVPEQRLLGRLSLFSNGFALAAAEAICADPDGDPLAAADVFEWVDQLVDKSLLLREETEGGALRYRLSETLRQYARERWQEQEEPTAVQERYRQWYQDLAIAAEPELIGSNQASWLRQMEEEHDNLRLAVQLSQQTGGAPHLKFCSVLCRYWYLRGHWSEGRGFLATALADPGAQEGTPPRAWALLGAGNLARSQGDYPAARQHYEAALVIDRALGDLSGAASVLNNLGTVLKEQGDYDQAQVFYAESLALCRTRDDKPGIARALHNLGMVANEQGDNEKALALYAESLQLSRALGNRFLEANTLNNLGNVANDQGDYRAARSLFEQSLALYRELGASTGIAFCLNNLGRVALLLGDFPTAQGQLEESFQLNRELGDQRGIAIALNNLGLVALFQARYEEAQVLLAQSIQIRHWRSVADALVALGHLALCRVQLVRATQLFGAAQQLCENLHIVLSSQERRIFDDDQEQLLDQLGQSAFTEAFLLGRALTSDAAIQLACSDA